MTNRISNVNFSLPALCFWPHLDGHQITSSVVVHHGLIGRMQDGTRLFRAKTPVFPRRKDLDFSLPRLCRPPSSRSSSPRCPVGHPVESSFASILNFGNTHKIPSPRALLLKQDAQLSLPARSVTPLDCNAVVPSHTEGPSGRPCRECRTTHTHLGILRVQQMKASLVSSPMELFRTIVSHRLLRRHHRYKQTFTDGSRRHCIYNPARNKNWRCNLARRTARCH